ncbi:MAG: ribonuclease D [Pseudomonadota bacterium]
MQTITTTAALAEFCHEAAQQSFVTVDTEFLRERTYYSKLCLIQLAIPGTDEDTAVLVDPLCEGLSLGPLYALFQDTSVVKVFHAARQDLEIFFIDAQVFPQPLFDTQVAAMVCGFGDQVGYETLVRKICRTGIDKTSRFTDWSRRPLSDAQKKYALADVTHLRQIYTALSEKIRDSGRSHWVDEELASLTRPETYTIEPRTAWRRVKTRTNSPKFLSLVRELAAFRETYAQQRNIPRNRVFKDDALIEVASLKPRTHEELGRARLLLREARKGQIAAGILDAITAGLSCNPDDMPEPNRQRDKLQVNPALADLLRVLLKAKTEHFGVAAKLIAASADLDAIAAGERDVAALHGWRKEVFGADALRLCSGQIALTARGSEVEVVTL